MKSRLVLLVLALLVWSGAIAARLHRVQITDHAKYSARAEDQQFEPVELTPPRGTIFDRKGRRLAVSVSVDSAFAPHGLENPREAARQIARVLGVDPGPLAERLGQGKWTWISRQMEPETALQLRALDIEGVHFVQESKRFYPLGRLAAPVLGFVGLDHSGLAGVEAAYDDDVSGEPVAGVVLRDARAGRAVTPGLSFVDATPGRDLHLTIDAGFQHVVERELEQAMQKHAARAATAIFMDPETGAVLAMASKPSFDPNRYRDSSEKDWRNRVIQDAYEPGSTLKLVTAAAALERNVLDPLDELDCEMGSITLGATRIRDHKPFARLTFGEVFAKSSNVGAIKAGLMAGSEELSRLIAVFGFGTPTGVDLPGESHGIVRPVERWSRNEVAYAAIGQGLSVTPLQLARAFAVIANGGRLVTPYVVGSVGSRQTEGKVLGEPVLSAATRRTLLRLLERVVEEGTGAAAAVPGYRIAGKTGTAQKAGPAGYLADRYVASFAGFAPSRQPRLVGVIAVDEPRAGLYHGGEVAAPIFAAILNQVLPLMGIAAEGPADQDSFSDSPAIPEDDLPAEMLLVTRPDRSRRGSPGEVPNFAGLSAREALELAAGAGVYLELEGSGFVRSQTPLAGAPSSEAGAVRLRLEPGRSG